MDRRARLLSGEYRAALSKIDRRVLGTGEGMVGPLVRRLEQFGDLQGLVVGAFGEGSEDLHSLVNTLAVSRLRAVGLARGREGADKELGVIVSQIRRTLSTSAVGSQASCLLSRMSCLGRGAFQAAGRMRWAAREEERMRAERSAIWLARVRGQSLVKRGQCMA